MQSNYKSISNLNIDIIKNLHRIPKDVALVVGIPRSGLLVANRIALHLNCALVDLDGFLSDRTFLAGLRMTYGRKFSEKAKY